MKKNTKIMIPAVVGILLVGILVGIFLYQKFSPGTERMDLTKYFGKDQEDAVTIILDDEICDVSAIMREEVVYLPLELVQEELNARFYWDSNENLLLYSTPTAVISAEAGSKDYYKSNSKASKDYEIVYVDADAVYVALDYVQEYTALSSENYENPDRVVLTHDFNVEKDYIKTDSACFLRYHANIKSEILVDLAEDAVLRLLEEDKDSGFCKVMEETGVIGYVRTKDLGEGYQDTKTTDFQEEEYTHILKEGKINLVWHQVTNQSANSKLLSLLSDTKGVTVICPTWFETSDNDGNITSLASDTYVTQAHQQGVEVWGLCSDFGANMKIGKVLGTTSKRQKLAKNLIAEAIRYSLDGINIDFENVKKASGEDFIQFIRELSIMCRNNGIVLSIDNYPVSDYSDYYNRTEQANVADYVITMAYDEYYSGSDEAGPVSSITYVKESAEKVLEQVPAEQAIIALPFYSRHWTEKTKDGKVVLSSEACSMSYAQEILSDSGASAEWDDTTGMNYLEYTDEGVIHKMWIEDINSLQLKMEEVAAKDTAGVAFWKLGMEDKSVWDMIYKYNK